MSRDWLAVYAAMLHKPKYRRLSPAAKGALLHVLMLATTTTPEATWTSRDELAELLVLDGFDAAVLDELATRGWLEDLPGGAVGLHGWDEWQLASTNAIGHAYEASRLRDWRRKKKASDPLPRTPSPVQDNTSHNKGSYKYVPERTRERAREELKHTQHAGGWHDASPDTECPECIAA